MFACVGVYECYISVSVAHLIWFQFDTSHLFEEGKLFRLLCKIPFWGPVFLKSVFPGGTSGKVPSASSGDVREMGSIPASRRSCGKGYGNPF